MVKIDIIMPTYCYDCPCHNGENGRCNITGDYVFDKRPFDCPLREDKSTTDDEEVKHGGWISVKERLPEEDGEYLIGWANSDEMYLSCFTRDCFGMSFGLRDEEQEHRPAWYYIDDEWGEEEWDNVEYWMEKPAPPETKGEENE